MTQGPTGSSLASDIRAYLEHLRVERGLAANSLAAYARDLRRYQAYCAARGVTTTAEIAAEDVTEYAAQLGSPASGLSNASAARMIVAVRGFHRYALAAGTASSDAAAAVSSPTAARRPPRALAPAEVAAILDAVGGPGAGPLGLRDRALLEFLYGTGARISEAVGLDMADLDVAGGSVVLFGGGRRREIPMGVAAATALTAYLGGGRPVLLSAVQPAVFLNARGGRLSRQSAWTVLQSAADRARLGVAVSPHTLRHSFAAHMTAEGADPLVVELLLGHAGASSSGSGRDLEALTAIHRSAHPRSSRVGGATPADAPPP